MSYKPNSLKELIGLEEIKGYLETLKENPKNIPNLFFYGSPGTGKTSTILAFLKELNIHKDNIHFFNLSYKNGVEFVRNRIMSLCKLKIKSQEIPYRFIILDEFDSLTTDSQPYISYCMRQYKNVKFCMISNSINTIISSIFEKSKLLHFDTYQEKDYLDLVKRVTKKKDVKSLCRVGCYDMRKIIKIKNLNISVLDRPLNEKLFEECDNSLKIYEYISQKVNEGYDYNYIFSFYKSLITHWVAKQYLPEIECWFMNNINYRNIIPSLSLAIYKMRSLKLNFPC